MQPVMQLPVMQPPAPFLVVHLKPSRTLGVVLGFAHFMAIVLLWPLMMPPSVKLASSALLVISLVFYLRRYALLCSPDSVSSLEVTDEMACTLNTCEGGQIACALLGSSFVTPYLTVLDLNPLKIDKTGASPRQLSRYFSRSIVILPDGINPEEFRQLRVLLRWKWRNQRGELSPPE
jgi:toxin CptA